jgi:histone H3/H4
MSSKSTTKKSAKKKSAAKKAQSEKRDGLSSAAIKRMVPQISGLTAKAKLARAAKETKSTKHAKPAKYRVGKGFVTAVRQLARGHLRDVLRSALVVMEGNGRSTILEKDVLYAYDNIGTKVYGGGQGWDPKGHIDKCRRMYMRAKKKEANYGKETIDCLYFSRAGFIRAIREEIASVLVKPMDVKFKLTEARLGAKAALVLQFATEHYLLTMIGKSLVFMHTAKRQTVFGEDVVAAHKMCL